MSLVKVTCCAAAAVGSVTTAATANDMANLADNIMGLSSGLDLEVWHGRPRARPIPSRVSVASRERLSILESTPVKGAIPSSSYIRLHLRFGWWSLLIFAAVGLALETLQGFKVPLYVDVSSDTRRLMWTLGHAHGIGLALVHLLFALSLPVLPPQPARDRLVSRCLI